MMPEPVSEPKRLKIKNMQVSPKGSDILDSVNGIHEIENEKDPTLLIRVGSFSEGKENGQGKEKAMRVPAVMIDVPGIPRAGAEARTSAGRRFRRYPDRSGSAMALRPEDRAGSG
jgi:hypothetical protein